MNIRCLSKPFLFLTFALLIGSSISSFAQEASKSPKDVQYGALYIGKRHDPDMNQWRQMRFGEFLHFGLYSILGGSWQGKHYNGAAEWIKAWAHIPDSAYFSLIHQFNPVDFDADAWAAMAKKMGAKYVRITTKHHEGFCLWPSKYTDFDIASSPYKKDLLGELIDACNKAGLKVSLYYSILDWHHPDWRSSIKSESDSVAYTKYKKYVKNQLTELLERYPSIIGMWFDGTWDKSWKNDGEFSYKLEKYLKKIHPGLIVNARLRADEYGARHFDSNGHLMGDYEDGFERKLPSASDTAVLGYDWEGIMTIPENQWGYNKIWNGHVKTADEMIELMTQAVSMGGNFLVNFGPKPDGSFRMEEQYMAKAIGAWMKVNGRAIYGCDHAYGWEKQNWGYYTSDTVNHKIYMVVFNTPISGLLKVKSPKGQHINRCYALSNPMKYLQVENIGKQEFYIHLIKQEHAQPYVIVLDIKQDQKKKREQNYHQPAKT